MTPEPIEDNPGWLIVAVVLMLFVFTTGIYVGITMASAAHSSQPDEERTEYLRIREYSNCTKANTFSCMGEYRMCQVAQCGEDGIDW